MKCFCSFRDKGRIRARKSPPNVKNQVNSDIPKPDKVTKSSNSATLAQSMPRMYGQRAPNLRVFTFAELRQATCNFNELLKIGEGGFGCVYKGTIKPVDGKGDPLVVAIKKLNRDGHQGHKQWVAEVQFLSVVEHPNLVKLIGYCAVDGERSIQRLLVYKYMPNKSLEYHLFNKAHPVLSWEQRLQIIHGAAQGLAYLHEGFEFQVIYRDFKSSNVLLDADFKPKLSDFGLAREGPANGHTHISTVVVGTYGYAAPEYIETGHLTSKSDVWSFGIVLYEILTGRRALERGRPRPEQKLLDLVKQHHGSKLNKILDPGLGNRFSPSAARRIAKLADSCLVKNPKDRPKMTDVVETLKQVIGSENSSEDVKGDDGVEEKGDEQKWVSESAKRRAMHLAKISGNLDERVRRRFVMQHKGKVA